MAEFPITPFAPRRLHTAGERLLLIGTEGELAWLNSQTLEPEGSVATPFPSPIQHSSVVGSGKAIVGMWTEYEMKMARMALIDAARPLESGIERSDLRIAKQSDSSPDVAGATWSHNLTAEPLGLCTRGDLVAFSIYTQGTYCTDIESNEIWRQPLIDWPQLEHIPDGNHICQMASSIDLNCERDDEKIWFWSAAGGWAVYDWDDGELQRLGHVELNHRLDSAWVNPNGEWLLGCVPERIAKWDQKNEPEIANVAGPIQDVMWIDGGWSIAGWREDIRWDENGLRRYPRNEIGIALVRHLKHGVLVLDNTGKWSKFGL